MENLNKPSPFIRIDEIESICYETLGIAPSSEILESLIYTDLLPVFIKGEDEFVLKDDLFDLLPILSNYRNIEECWIANELRIFIDELKLDPDVISSENIKAVEYVNNPMLRNLINFYKNNLTSMEALKKHSNYDIKNKDSNKILNFDTPQFKRTRKVVQSRASYFARSAYYMGSKKILGAFLIEAISRYLPPEGNVIDLMCGSGAASQAFSTNWATYASDAQCFSRHLAKVQGKGFTEKKAIDVLNYMYPHFKKNVTELDKNLNELIKKEDVFFHSNIDIRLLEDYKAFQKESSCYPRNESLLGWQLFKEVEKRNNNPTLTPYCLFTTYFANIYFGLRQSVEIDSIRYAIDQLDDHVDKNWALGALISTLSSLGSGYAAQFAQPIEPTLKKLPFLLQTRARSVMHEFSVIFTTLAKESERSPHSIDILPGPWEETLLAAENIIREQNVVVYLDAPYKRDEYSRYYHLLETAVIYNYPSATLKGRLPDKKKGERFKSTFFTRNRGKLEAEIVKIICSILNRGWICAWSYSDNGDASIVDVINQIYYKKECQVISFATSYQHKPQGKSKSKTVTEYCILFNPSIN